MITSTGIGSGIDINGLVSQLMEIEREPVTRIKEKQTTLDSKLTAYGTLKGAFSSFQLSMAGMSSVSRFKTTSATASDTSLISVTAGDEASEGKYSIEVKKLAQSHKLISQHYTSTSDSVGTGTLTIQFGTYNSLSNQFTANNDKTSQTITIDSTNSTLSGIRDKINASKIGVTASIMNDGNGNRLVLTSNDTGAANSLKISVTGDNDAVDNNTSGLSALAYDPTYDALTNNTIGKNMVQTIEAQDALLKVDGVDNITKSSNVVSDVLEGVTIKLLKESAANTPSTISVSKDSSIVKKAVEDFVKAYNDLNKVVKDLTYFNLQTGEKAILKDDSAAAASLNRIRVEMTKALPGGDNDIRTLPQIGVSIQRTGSLSLDSAKLQKAIDTHGSDAVAALFARVGTSSDTLIGYSSSTVDTKPGVYAVNITQLATRSVYSGSSSGVLADDGSGGFLAPVVVDGDNDTFKIKVNGTESETITLSQGTYSTVNTLISEIQSKINGDSALKTGGAKVTVSFDDVNDSLVFTSDRYGSASKVEFTQGDVATESTLGLWIGEGTIGVDVAGEVNGVAATGAGRFLNVTSGDGKGLKIEVKGGSTGSRGSIRYTEGYGAQLNKLADLIAKTNGLLDTRTKGLTNQKQRYTDQIAAMEKQLTTREKRYFKQYNAMDAIVGKLKSTSDYLTQQIDSWNASKK